jgi:hypothetical protein
MQRQALNGVICVGTLSALLILPTAAVAKHGEEVIGASQSADFQLKGSKGYSISVSGNRETVTLTAKRGSSSATYMTDGFVSPKKIKARLGRLGRVSVRFHPHGRPKRIPASQYGCRGKAETVRSGIWVGRIEFEGEQAYTAVHATRANGTATSSPKLKCSSDEGMEGKEGKSSDTRLTVLNASSDAGPVIVTALLIRSKAHPNRDLSGVGASLIETRGRRLVIFRSINSLVKDDAVTLNEDGGHITSLTIAPPAPFTGTATFQRTQGSKGSWTGTLAGAFPGRGELNLAGLEFSAEVSRIGTLTGLISLIHLGSSSLEASCTCNRE